MHASDLRDFTCGRLISTEVQNRGTLLHELGHVLFDCADEYDGGAHRSPAYLPDNWETPPDAQAAAPSRHKAYADAVEIGDGWSKICAASCVLNDQDDQNPSTFDAPCVDRLLARLLWKHQP